jgi:hypothetical protein
MSVQAAASQTVVTQELCKEIEGTIHDLNCMLTPLSNSWNCQAACNVEIRMENLFSYVVGKFEHISPALSWANNVWEEIKGDERSYCDKMGDQGLIHGELILRSGQKAKIGKIVKRLIKMEKKLVMQAEQAQFKQLQEKVAHLEEEVRRLKDAVKDLEDQLADKRAPGQRK